MRKRVVKGHLHNATTSKMFMSPKKTTWRILHNNVASLARSVLLIGTVTSTICITFIASKQYSDYLIWLGMAVVFSISLSLAFIKKYLAYRKLEHFIILDIESLTIPTSMMRDRKINLAKIKSLETLHYLNKTKGLIIGLSNGSSEVIDARVFESDAAFEDFILKLFDWTKKDGPNTSNNDNRTLKIERIKNNDKTMRFIVLTIFAVFTTTTSGLEEITNKAIEVGALTKSSSQLPELYRVASSFFLHFETKHFLINVLCLIFIGRNVDIILGALRFSGILFGSAFAGSLLSLTYSGSDYVIGASGGIMGLLGAYSVICLKYQHCIQGSVSTSVKKIFFVLFLQVVSDLTVEGIDVLSHAGGFLFGTIYTIFFLDENQFNEISVHSRVEAIVAGAISSFYLIGLFSFLFRYL